MDKYRSRHNFDFFKELDLYTKIYIVHVISDSLILSINLSVIFAYNMIVLCVKHQSIIFLLLD